jgi:hypothetical protein
MTILAQPRSSIKFMVTEVTVAPLATSGLDHRCSVPVPRRAYLRRIN